MIILVDMDGVLANIGVVLEQKIKERWPNAVRNGHHFHREQDYGLDRNDLKEVFYEERFFLDLPVMEGAVDGVKKLMEQHEVFICTSPVTSRYCSMEKMQWIDEHFPALRKRIVISKDKTIISGTFLIDDKPEITGVKEPDWVHIKFKHPYNDGWFDWSRIDDFLDVASTGKVYF